MKHADREIKLGRIIGDLRRNILYFDLMRERMFIQIGVRELFPELKTEAEEKQPTSENLSRPLVKQI